MKQARCSHLRNLLGFEDRPVGPSSDINPKPVEAIFPPEIPRVLPPFHASPIVPNRGWVLCMSCQY